MPAVHKVISASRIFTTTIENVPGVGSDTRAVAGITEVDGNGNPFMGASGMKIYNVVSRPGRFEVRGEVDWEPAIRVRVTVLYE
jgi:hypothetical protein